jgi:hypothetical protein
VMPSSLSAPEASSAGPEAIAAAGSSEAAADIR